jgi:hypothetical protein
MLIISSLTMAAVASCMKNPEAVITLLPSFQFRPCLSSLKDQNHPMQTAHVEISLTIGSLAWIFSAVLTEPGEVFGWWPPVVQRVTGWLPINKLLYGCAKCMAGFWTLWASLAMGYGWHSIQCAGLAILTALVLDRYVGA